MTENNFQVVKKETIDIVESRIKAFTQKGELHFPKGYSPDNALKAAWLLIQEVKDKDKNPALNVCTRHSVANALLNMVVQGLNPAKKQCYFIVYGNQLACQRSYFGTMAMLKRVRPEILDIVAETMHEGDKPTVNFTETGRRFIEKVVTEWGNQDKPLIGAYCNIVGADYKIIHSAVMTFEQLKQAWAQSKTYPVTKEGKVKTDSTHGKFMSEMAKKTVINRACKHLLNASDDSDLITNAIHESDEIRVDNELADEIEADASRELIDINPETGEAVQAGEPDTPESQEQQGPQAGSEGSDDIEINYKRQLEKMEKIDPDLFATAVDLCNTDVSGDDIPVDVFEAVSKKFNELMEGREAGSETAADGKGPDF